MKTRRVGELVQTRELAPGIRASDLSLVRGGFSLAQIERLAWNLAVIREQLGDAELTVVGGNEDAEGGAQLGCSFRAAGHDAPSVHATVLRAMRAGLIDRGAVGLYTDRVYYDLRGRCVRGFGDAEERAHSDEDIASITLRHGLEIRRVYPDGECISSLADPEELDDEDQDDDGPEEEGAGDPLGGGLAGALALAGENPLALLQAVPRKYLIAGGVALAGVGAGAAWWFLKRRRAQGGDSGE